MLFLGGRAALYIAIAVLGLVGPVLVTRLPELEPEGDPRWALITRVIAPEANNNPSTM